MKKKLQNWFTTPEQSKRLLKIGVPEKTADCYVIKFIGHNYFSHPMVCWYEYERHKEEEGGIAGREFLPCWSAGRLFELILLVQELCGHSERYLRIKAERYDIEHIVTWIERIYQEEVDLGLLLGGVEYE